MKEVYYPAVRGLFGEWVYYSCIVPAREVADRVNFADDIHKSKQLSSLIQRELKAKRGKEIAHYLKSEKERFFNSLVIAVYGGKPEWLESSMSPSDKVNTENISDDALSSLGFLKLSGKEKLFAIDGQHRLAGIKEATKSAGAYGDDEVSVIMIGHKNTKAGMIRTRRLFTTLNKKAVVVSKGEIIALDENDVMAITSRRMIEENKLFSGNRIAVKATNNIADQDVESLTTIGNLYDLLGIIFSGVLGKGRVTELKNAARPSDQELDEFFEASSKFFSELFRQFSVLKEFSQAGKEATAVKKYRGKHGGSVLYRPLGLLLVLELISSLVGTGLSSEEAIKKVAHLPLSLNQEPFKDVFWDSTLERINTKARVAVRDLLLVRLGVLKDKKKIKQVHSKYEKLLRT